MESDRCFWFQGQGHGVGLLLVSNYNQTGERRISDFQTSIFFSLQCYQCSHQKKIFAIDMKRKPRGLSKKKGTQTIDRAWLSLKRFLPKEANKKKGKGMFAEVRDLLEERVKQWSWRAELLRVNPHLSKQQFLKHLAKVC